MNRESHACLELCRLHRLAPPKRTLSCTSRGRQSSRRWIPKWICPISTRCIEECRHPAKDSRHAKSIRYHRLQQEGEFCRIYTGVCIRVSAHIDDVPRAEALVAPVHNCQPGANTGWVPTTHFFTCLRRTPDVDVGSTSSQADRMSPTSLRSYGPARHWNCTSDRS